ncbi:MAG: NAD(P)/FAD-dependent oxidoreductase [Desulfarculaceae bacterium]|jgi:dihydrolipoamide dehydrogenase
MSKVVVIGAGPGGIAAAIRAAQLGAEVILVEAAEVGGVCMNRGCIPLRVLGAAAGSASAAERWLEIGLKEARAELDLKRLQDRLHKTVTYMRMGSESLLQSHGVRIIKGRARLNGPASVQAGDETISADKIILATGAGWQRPPIPGADLKGVITSDDFFRDLAIPKRLLVLGGPLWSVEVAAFCSRFGSEVTLAVPGPWLPQLDRQISSRLKAILKKDSITVLSPAEAVRIIRKSPGLETSISIKGNAKAVASDLVLTTQRAPRLEGLGLDAAGIRTSEGAVAVDRKLCTSNPRVYALGDLVGEPLLSHKASAQGIIAAENAMGQEKDFEDRAIPQVLYTCPEAASVGLTEKEAKGRGYEVVVGEIPYGVNGRAMAENSSEGFVKVVCGARYQEVLGVHLLGPHSSELITQAALAIQLEATAAELAQMIAPHPAFAESLADAARMVLGQALYVPKQSG